MDATKNLRNKLILVGTKNCFVEYALTVAIVHRRLNTHVHLDEMRKNDKTHARIEPHRVNCYSYWNASNHHAFAQWFCMKRRKFFKHVFHSKTQHLLCVVERRALIPNKRQIARTPKYCIKKYLPFSYVPLMKRNRFPDIIFPFYTMRKLVTDDKNLRQVAQGSAWAGR